MKQRQALGNYSGLMSSCFNLIPLSIAITIICDFVSSRQVISPARCKLIIVRKKNVISVIGLKEYIHIGVQRENILTGLRNALLFVS